MLLSSIVHMGAVSFVLGTRIHETDGRVNPEIIFIFQIDKYQKLGIWVQGLRTGRKHDIINDLIEPRGQRTGCRDLFAGNDLEQEETHGG